MSEKKTIVSNSDNEDCMPIGYVDHINGNGAEEVAGFVPTRHELLQLAKYWSRIILENNVCLWAHSSSGSGSREILENTFAVRRIARIKQLIGRDVVEAACLKVEADYAKHMDPEEWQRFKTGLPKTENS